MKDYDKEHGENHNEVYDNDCIKGSHKDSVEDSDKDSDRKRNQPASQAAKQQITKPLRPLHLVARRPPNPCVCSVWQSSTCRATGCNEGTITKHYAHACLVSGEGQDSVLAYVYV